MKFDMPKAVFCGLALIAAGLYFGHGAKPSQAAFGSESEVGRYQCVKHESACAFIIDTKTSEVRQLERGSPGPGYRKLWKLFGKQTWSKY